MPTTTPTFSDSRSFVSTFTHLTMRIARRWSTGAIAILLAGPFALVQVVPAHAQQFQLLYEFPLAKTGNAPSALLNAGGNFFGATANGGKSNVGTIFKLSSTGTLTTLYSFNHNSTDGRNPTVGPLVRDRAGNLYGTTQNGGNQSCVVFTRNGCGTVFKLSPSGKETILHSFSGGPGDGANPLAGLTMDSAGNLYGTTYVGGIGCPGTGCGTVYKVTPSGVETVLYSFTGGTDGANPYYVSLVIDSAGNLYGTTGSGGDLSCLGSRGNGCGVVFKVAPSGKETVLYAFAGGANGGGPSSGVARDSQGNLYGTLTSGGSVCRTCGLVFKLDPSGNETVLHNFTKEEVQPDLSASNLIVDSAGNLYGTTFYGGAFSDGTVFEISNQGQYTLLHAFDQSDGIWPQAGLLRDAAGNIFGTTSQGGINSCNLGCGVIFKITP